MKTLFIVLALLCVAVEVAANVGIEEHFAHNTARAVFK